MNWPLIALIVYILFLIAVCLRIVFETHSTNKTLAYLLFCIFIPVIGVLFYITFGINYWRKRKYSKKSAQDLAILEQLKTGIASYNDVMVPRNAEVLLQNSELASMLVRDLGSPLTKNNRVKILVNGEQKFPEMMEAIRQAKHHVHIEYYIFEYDHTGMALVDLLVIKANEGVEVRFIYDDFGSHSINNKTEARMQAAGIKIYPFHKIQFYLFANRINYRNHRKIVVVDGGTAFVGGINISDRYVNDIPNKLYWRDTHLRIDGPAVYYLQYLFISDWSFCCSEKLQSQEYYSTNNVIKHEGSYVQIAASGPDSLLPSVLYSILQVIYLAKEEILITTPYFIPGESIIDALCVSALSGLSVKLLVPGKSDSMFVNAASKSYYERLLQAGVQIYMYQKGFVHAKTIVTDQKLCVVGTANMDNRSFDLNFEVNAIVYDNVIAKEMRQIFYDDLQHATQINKEEWFSRPWYEKFPGKIARLFSPVM